ncbi:MAG: alpha/beta hydrolase [Myxococcota bacterium]
MMVRSGFATTRDGIALYWRHAGGGPKPTFVCCNGLGVSTFFFKYIVERFAGEHGVLVWDYRGHGRSALPPEPMDEADLSIETCAEDLHEVLEAAGVARPIVLLGHSMGCQVLLEYAYRYPGEVAGLVPLFGTAGRPVDTFLNTSLARPALGLLRRAARIGGPKANRWLRPLYESPLIAPLAAVVGFVDLEHIADKDLREYLEHLGHLDPRIFLRMAALAGDHDAGPYLAGMEAPALVVAGGRDSFTPLHLSERMAKALPHSDLMVLSEATHAAIVEHPHSINARIAKFVERDVLPRAAVLDSARGTAK